MDRWNIVSCMKCCPVIWLRHIVDGVSSKGTQAHHKSVGSVGEYVTTLKGTQKRYNNVWNNYAATPLCRLTLQKREGPELLPLWLEAGSTPACLSRTHFAQWQQRHCGSTCQSGPWQPSDRSGWWPPQKALGTDWMMSGTGDWFHACTEWCQNTLLLAVQSHGTLPWPSGWSWCC